MTKSEFADLLDSALQVAAQNAELRLKRSVSRHFVIDFHGLAPMARTITQAEALDLLYLGPDVFYRLIDVAVIKVDENMSTIFMRISGHKPSTLQNTWDPGGAGPFKQLQAAKIEVGRTAP
jgi:hypothetical protein